jgi:hypothetical protein
MAGVKGVFIMADMIKVRSASDATVVINSPETMMVKTWNKMRSILLHAMFSCSLITIPVWNIWLQRVFLL